MSEYSAFGTDLKVGVAQVETATATGTITGSGNATVTVTGSGITGSPVATSVSVTNGDSPTTWAGKVRTALNLVAVITALYEVGGSGTSIVLTRKIAAANDGTLNIALANDTCTGITPAASSANTRAGVALASIAQISNIGGPGLQADVIDVTTHDSTAAYEESVVGILRTGELTLDIVYDPNGATHSYSAGLLGKIEARTLYDFSITFPSSGTVTWYFDGYVTGFEPSAPVDGALTASVTIKLTGQPTLA